jgi:uncharacterized heparinase superfamily protein
MPSTSLILTYWNTVRYLRPIQLYGRAWFRLARPRPDLRVAPHVRPPCGPWASPARRRASLIGPSSFQFLNKEYSLADIGWDSPVVEKLWRYNLHYFDDLNSDGADSREVWHSILLARWVDENPPAHGTGWEPYPTSLRIVNWIKWQLGGHGLSPECVHSLAVQVRWLARRLEWHLLGNHLFTNAKALVFAGLYFSGAEAQRWLEKGMRILAREMPEQILPDGAQFERTPMYQALALEDLLDLCNVSIAFRSAVPEKWLCHVHKWAEFVGPMRNHLAAMCHPDGAISFFNDAAFGIAPTLEELDAYAKRVSVPMIERSLKGVTHLAPSGYIRVQLGSLVALLDVAPIGPDYLPAHAHADTLSFELSLFEERLLVNSGTAQYVSGKARSRQRSTAAHNTVTIDALDSSEVWSSFRVARRARPHNLRVAEFDETIVVNCSHDGYERLPGRPVHHREWQFKPNELRVVDRISGTFRQAVAHFHLHPAIEISERQELRLGNGKLVQWSCEGGTAKIVPSSWYPKFGCSIANRCIEIQFEGPEVRFRLRW